MAGQRLPTNVVLARGAKHFTKEEIKNRLNSEVQPVDDDIIAPNFLTKKQADEFYKIVGQLRKLKIIGETDVDALGRYLVAKDFYVNAVKQMRKKEVREDPILFESWSKIHDRYYKQCRSSANDLGLSISSRCKLVVPKVDDAPKENKFKVFEKGRVVGE